jgi:small-conductance mechanosensitive channel
VALPSSLLLAGLVVAILRTPLHAEDAAAPSMRVLRAIRSLVWIAAGAIVLCALAGYLPLARFLAQQLVVTGSILALVYLLLLWVDGFAQSIGDDGAFAGHWLKQRVSLERRRREQLALPIGLLLKLAVLVLSVPLIMLQWGYNWPDIQEWYRQLFFGFHIGNTHVSFGALLAALIVCGGPPVPGLARRAGPAARRDLRRRTPVDPHRRRLYRHPDRRARRVFLCGIQSVEPRHRCRRVLDRYRLWPAELGQ